MSNERLKDLLAKLADEVENTTAIDDETLKLVEDLDANLREKVIAEGDGESTADEFTDLASALEARFSANHPTAEAIVREIIDILGKMGI